MTIYHFLNDSNFGPEEIKIIVAAYERACQKLGLTDKSEPTKQLVAKKVYAIAQTGERNTQTIIDRVMWDFQSGLQKPE